LLIFIFVLQLAAIPAWCSGGGDQHAQNAKSVMLAGNFNDHIPVFSQDNKKPSLKLSTIKLQDFSKAQGCCQDYSVNDLNCGGVIFDFRRQIQDTISHYFHASKYKISRLFI
jgi:hypothetical protein